MDWMELPQQAGLVGLLIFASACGGDDAPAGDAGVSDSISIQDGSSMDTGLDSGLPSAQAFVAPAGEWTAVTIEGARCGNGSTMPVAVNLSPDSDEVVVYFQGGGACWDMFSCVTIPLATHINENVTEATVLREAQASPVNRIVGNPFRDANFIYVPYCTGDLHDGQQVADYGGQPIHHVGALNSEIVLSRAAATVPSAARVWLFGVSAGGYGAALNLWRARNHFPGSRVDVLADCAPLVDFVGERWESAFNNWDPALPPGCDDCADGLSRLLAHYDRTITDPYRYGLLVTDNDQTIRTFMGLDTAGYRAALMTLRGQMSDTDTQRSYLISSSEHVLIGNPGRTTTDGTVLLDWIADFADDSAPFENAGP